ncbi:MAG: Txe/YoeB family addiction module toxin [Synergistaceae bacterium]|jgi:toxin YoeB|nr:Txe/YoeB family addiction module toxin [Synergistaceae bacterium]
MPNLSFLPEAWEDYIYWQSQGRKMLNRLNRLLQDICRNAYEGIGKLEPLSGNMSGWWSRRIDDTHRVIYRMEGDSAIIAQCRSHYGE